MLRLALPLALLVSLAGCMGGDSAATIDRSGLKGVVLQPGDLPRLFSRFDEGRQATIDQPRGTRADPARFGRQDGWKARYRRAGSAATRGPLVVESRVDTFKSSGGARDELEAHRSQLAQGLRLSDERPELGEEAFVATGTQGSGDFAVRFYLVAWRHENATASVFANGFDGKFTLGEALSLARKQQRRLEKAVAVATT